MRYAVLFVSMMMLVFVAAVAQESASPAGNQADISAAPETGTASDASMDVVDGYEEPGEEPKGDTVILDDGRRFEGVQVLRRTATDIEIEIVKGMAPLALPREVVKEIVWDDYEPSRQLTPGAASNTATRAPRRTENALPEGGLARDEQGNIEILPRVKVPAQLAGKLRTDITQVVRDLNGKDLFEALNLIKQATQLQIAADQPLRVLASNSGGLKVNVTLNEDVKVNAVEFLENHLLKQKEMQAIAIQYQPDRIIVTTKEAVAKIKQEQEE